MGATAVPAAGATTGGHRAAACPWPVVPRDGRGAGSPGQHHQVGCPSWGPRAARRPRRAGGGAVSRPRTLQEARAMVLSMRELRETAPDGLGASVLAQLGMADGYAEVEGPIARLYVAWGEDGVIAVERIGDPMGFETEVQLRTGRPIVRMDRLPAELE